MAKEARPPVGKATPALVSSPATGDRSGPPLPPPVPTAAGHFVSALLTVFHSVVVLTCLATILFSYVHKDDYSPDSELPPPPIPPTPTSAPPPPPTTAHPPPVATPPSSGAATPPRTAQTAPSGPAEAPSAPEDAPSKSSRRKKAKSSELDPRWRDCCAVSSHELLQCANHSAVHTRQGRVIVVTMVTASIEEWARYSVAVTAEWARARGYEMLVVGDDHPVVAGRADALDSRFSKVPAVRTALADPAVELVFWLDADAVVVGHQLDLRHLAAQHPHHDLIVCREGNLETNNLMNSGAMVWRRSQWSLDMLQAWYEHPSSLQGAPDQYSFDRLWEVNALGVQTKTALLPATVINSEPPWYETWQSPEQQPVVHLMGDHDIARLRVFQRAHRSLCTSRHMATRDWPVSKEWMLAEMKAAFLQVGEEEHRGVFERVQALSRLGQIYGYEGAVGDRIRVVEQALAMNEEQFGAEHQALIHDLQVLGNLHSLSRNPERALYYMNRALALSKTAVNPIGQRYEHLEPAILVDMASHHGRNKQYEAALPLLEQALAIEERVHGPHDKNVGDTLHNMGTVLKMMGRIKDGNRVLRRAMQIYSDSLTPDHPYVKKLQFKIDNMPAKW